MTDAGAFQLDPDEVARSIVKLPSLPAIVLDLLQSMENDGISGESLAAKISGDQALVARLLRIANSSFYGLQRKVLSIPDAIFVLGMSNVRTIALGATLSDSLSRQLNGTSFNFNSFWRHSVGTALCAQALAEKFKCSRESAFAAGLMHDIGQLVLATAFPQHLEAVRKQQLSIDCQTYEAEWGVLGTDHARIGQLLTRRWNFPDALSEAVGAHHNPELLSGNRLACTIHLADAIAHCLDLNGDEREFVPRIFPHCWSAAGLAWSDTQEIFAQVEKGLDTFCNLLSIS